MSRACTPAEFEQICDQWARAYQPITGREQEAWLSDWDRVIEPISYLKLVSQKSGFALHEILLMRCRVVNPTHLAFTKGDFAQLWKARLAYDLEAAHTTEDTEQGFDFRFAALNASGAYVPGRIEVFRL